MPTDYLTDADLVALGLDPDAVNAGWPGATPYTALDGARCWAAADLAPALDGGAA